MSLAGELFMYVAVWCGPTPSVQSAHSVFRYCLAGNHKLFCAVVASVGEGISLPMLYCSKLDSSSLALVELRTKLGEVGERERAGPVALL